MMVIDTQNPLTFCWKEDREEDLNNTTFICFSYDNKKILTCHKEQSFF